MSRVGEFTSFVRDWSKRIGRGSGPEQRGGRSSVFEPLERGGSFDFQRHLKGGSFYFQTGIGIYLKVLFLRMESLILL